MELTELQKDLIQLLKVFIHDTTSIIAIMLMLKKEEQQLELVKYIAENKKAMNKSIIIEKSMEIVNNK